MKAMKQLSYHKKKYYWGMVLFFQWVKAFTRNAYTDIGTTLLPPQHLFILNSNPKALKECLARFLWHVPDLFEGVFPLGYSSWRSCI